MKKYLHLIFFILLLSFFFYPVFQGKVPFPGDLLLAEYQPWRSYSFDGIAPGGIPNKAQYFDTLRQMYPWKTVIIDEIRNGTFPLWNPYNFSGTPLFANFQSAVLFPLNIFYIFLPQQLAWTILVISQPFLCLAAIYLLSRQIGISKTGSILSSISYSFSLYMTTFLEYNIMGHFMYLLPFGLYAIELTLDKKRFGPFLLIAVIAISLFAGHFQLVGGILGFLLFYILLRSIGMNSGRESVQKIFFLTLLIMLGIGVAGIQLVPGLELVLNSSRTAHPSGFILENLLIQPWQLILYLIPDLFGNPAVKNYLLPYSYPSKALYIGLLPFILFCIGLFSKKNPPIRTLGITSLFVALFVVLNPLSYLLFKFEIPLLSSSSPSNYIFMISVGLCILAGLGYDFLENLKIKKVIVVLGFIFSAFSATLVVTYFLNIQISKSNFIFSSILLVISLILIFFLKKYKKRYMFAILIVAFVTLDLFYFFHKFNPFVKASYIYPSVPVSDWIVKNNGIERVWGYSYAHINPNFQSQLKIYSPEGYDPLYSKTYHDLMLSSGSNTSRSDALLTNGFGDQDITSDLRRLKILSITGTRLILDKKENGSTQLTFPSAYFELKNTIGDFNIFWNNNASDRFFLTKTYQTYNNFESFKKQLYSDGFDPGSSVLLEKKVKLSNNPLLDKSTELKVYKSNSVSIQTNANTDALLYLSDSYYPGWNAYIDGKKTEILKANYAFRAVVVPEGKHLVTFKYEPKSFFYGALISLISIIISIIFITFKYYANKK